MKKTKLQKNNSILEQTGWNKARIFVIVGLVVSIIKLERVNLKKIVKVLNPENTKEVNYRRLSRFFQKFRFDKTTMAKLMSSFFPNGKLILSMDRSKSANSNYRDRIRVMKKFIDVFGVDRIEILVADREFVGEVWFRWLKKRKIPFAIRVMNNKHVKVGRGSVRVDSLFSNIKIGE